MRVRYVVGLEENASHVSCTCLLEFGLAIMWIGLTVRFFRCLVRLIVRSVDGSIGIIRWVSFFSVDHLAVQPIDSATSFVLVLRSIHRAAVERRSNSPPPHTHGMPRSMAKWPFC